MTSHSDPGTSTMTMTTLPGTLHDYISLGEVEQGLALTSSSSGSSSGSSSHTTTSSRHAKHQEHEIQRLPLFLRLLSSTRPLVFLSLFDSSNSINNNDNKDKDDKSPKITDPLVHRTVERLERVAAFHSVAEGIDVVTCYLVPSMTRKLCRVPPLTQALDTQALLEVARDPKGAMVAGNTSASRSTSTHKRQKRDEYPQEQGHAPESDDGENQSWADHPHDDDDDDNDDKGESDSDADQPTGGRRRQRKRKAISLANNSRRTSLEVAAEDSQEATVVKTLSELIKLVATSLEPFHHHHADDPPTNHQHPHSHSHAQEDHHPKDTDPPAGNQSQFSHGKGQLVLTIDDSILAETGREGIGGAMELSDLGATVAAILYHAPVLRSRHVANALCRASIPQISNLMTLLGANCPASVPSLLLGCIQAYESATTLQNTTIANMAKHGVLALAQLSPREQSRVMYKLQTKRIMWDIQLELALQQDPLVDQTLPARLLVQQILLTSSSSSSSHSTHSSLSATHSNRQQQAADEEVRDDYRMRVDNDDSQSSSTNRNEEPPLPTLLFKRPILFRKALVYLSHRFQEIAQEQHQPQLQQQQSKTRIPRGQLLLFLRAYGCLLLLPYPSTHNFTKLELSKYLVDTMLPSLRALTDMIYQHLSTLAHASNLPPTSAIDTVMDHFYCSVILTAARILEKRSESNLEITTTTTTTTPTFTDKECLEWISRVWEFPCPSLRLQTFTKAMNMAMLQNAPLTLHGHVVAVLKATTTASPSSSGQNALPETFSLLEPGLQQLCEMRKSATPMVPTDEDPSSIGYLSTTLSSFLFQMDQNDTEDMNPIIKSTLETVLLLMTDQGALPYHGQEHGDLLAQFVSKATQRLVKAENDGLNLPFVLSTSLEQQASRLFQEQGASKAWFQFLLQLLHAFEFLDAKPKSPFAMDARSLPLQKALEVAALLPGEFLRNRLVDLTTTHCGDVRLQLERTKFLVASSELHPPSIFTSLSRRHAVEVFYEAMRSFVVNTPTNPEANGVESIFLQAKSTLSDADLCSTVCNAFLATTHRPRLNYTYHILCRDPLVLLKCPLRIWKVRSLRRVALAVMSLLLESNAVLVHQTSPLESSADEYLSARNVIVIRCLLMCVCGIDTEVSPSDCAMTSGFIRSLLSGHDGVVATLIKQGLSERAVDWLVEYVPECMNDSQDLLQLLSDRSSLTASERLVAADAVLRIAIVHGQSNDEEAAIMAYAALSQVVDSFFLVVGPVGVPVSALIVDDSGLDVTQICRKAAFRILKALNHVRGRRPNLRKECGMALQKLAALCKSESTVAGVAGAVAGRRKILLKEMFDLIMKAAITMGNVVAPPSTAA